MNDSSHKPVLKDIKDISRLLLRILKELSEAGEHLSLEILADRFSSEQELLNLIELANQARRRSSRRNA